VGASDPDGLALSVAEGGRGRQIRTEVVSAGAHSSCVEEEGVPGI
jgi:hypothetical protein